MTPNPKPLMIVAAVAMGLGLIGLVIAGVMMTAFHVPGSGADIGVGFFGVTGVALFLAGAGAGAGPGAGLGVGAYVERRRATRN